MPSTSVGLSQKSEFKGLSEDFTLAAKKSDIDKHEKMRKKNDEMRPVQIPENMNNLRQKKIQKKITST